MQSYNDLQSQLKTIDHKSYPLYKSLRGSYQFPKYILSIDHVQGDPFAAPSDVRVTVDAIGISILVLPAIFKREIHPIQQDCIKQLCIARHLFKQVYLDECFWHTVETVSVCFQTSEIRVLHVDSSPPLLLDLHYYK